MTKTEFRAAYRMARLVRRFERDMRLGTTLTYAIPQPAFAARVGQSISDLLSAGYEGTGHRCGRRRPRMIHGPRGVLPA